MTPDAGQVPSVPCSTSMGATQPSGMHLPTEHRPKAQLVSDERVVPGGHEGVHDSPCASDGGQSPAAPSAGMSVLHPLGSQLVALATPKVHVVGPGRL
jgi:hypothetical protein